MSAPTESITQIEGAEKAADIAATKSTAKSLASLIASKIEADAAAAPAGGGQPGDLGQGDDITPYERSLIGPDDQVRSGAPAQQGEPGTPGAPADQVEEIIEEIVQMSPEELDALEMALQSAGLNISTRASELPVDAQGPYLDALEQLTTIVQDVQEREAQAREQQIAMEEFAEKLDKSPDKILLALALNRPEIFAQVVEIVNEANSDPKVMNLVVRELEIEARQNEINRRDKVSDEREQLSKARVVIAATKRAASAHGVPYEVAEKVVAYAVQANGGDLDVNEVDNIVKDLAGTGPKAAIRRVRRVVTPADKARAAANQPGPAPATPQGAPDKRDPNLSPGLNDGSREKSGGMFRNLVRDASRRIASTQRNQ